MMHQFNKLNVLLLNTLRILAISHTIYVPKYIQDMSLNDNQYIRGCDIMRDETK